MPGYKQQVNKKNYKHDDSLKFNRPIIVSWTNRKC